MGTLIQDVLFGARTLRRGAGVTIAAGLSLALGIGITTAIFTVLNAVALRPLPYADSGRLFWITQILRKNSTDEVTLTWHFLEWRRQNRSFTNLAGYNYQTRNLTGVDEPIELRTAKASASLLPILGVQPAIGRNFHNEEDYKGRDQVALLGAELWERQFEVAFAHAAQPGQAEITRPGKNANQETGPASRQPPQSARHRQHQPILKPLLHL